MKTLTQTILIVTCLLGLSTGCASLDERLASPDVIVRGKAFIELMSSKNLDLAMVSRAVNSIKDPKQLKRLVLSANDLSVRKSAFSAIEDQEFIVYVAQNSDSVFLRVAAINRIIDQELLKSIALNGTKYDALEYEKISEDLSYRWYRKFYESNLAEVQKAALAKLNDNETIAMIAKNASSSEVRQAAVMRISDKDTLSSLFYSEKEWNLRKLIAQRSGVPSLLSEVESVEVLRNRALTESRWKARLDAVERLRSLRDDDVLVQIAMRDEKKDVRLAAIEKIGEEEKAINVANHYLGPIKESLGRSVFPVFQEEFLAIIHRLHSTSYLEGLFADLTLRRWTGLMKALCPRVGQSVLAEAAVTSKNEEFVRECVKYLNEQDALIKIARGESAVFNKEVDPYRASRLPYEIRQNAIRRLTDLAVLCDIARFDDIHGIQMEAKERIQELGVAGLAENPSPEYIMRAARGEFGEKGQLVVLRMSDISKEVYSIAFKGFLSRERDGFSSYDQDNELIKKCPYDDLVLWVATHIHDVVLGDRAYRDEINAKEELVRRGLYSQKQLDDEIFKHDMFKLSFFGILDAL